MEWWQNTTTVMAEHRNRTGTLLLRPMTICNHHLQNAVIIYDFLSFLLSNLWKTKLVNLFSCLFGVVCFVKTPFAEYVDVFESLTHLWSHFWCIFRLIKSPCVIMLLWFTWRHSHTNDLQVKYLGQKWINLYADLTPTNLSHNFKITQNSQVGIKSLASCGSWCVLSWSLSLSVRWPSNPI